MSRSILNRCQIIAIVLTAQNSRLIHEQTERRQSQITHVAAHRCVHRWPTGRWLTLLTERSIASNTREVSVKRGSLD